MISIIFNRLRNMLQSPWARSLTVVACLSSLIWFIGPLIVINDSAVLKSANSRLTVTLLILICGLLYSAFSFSKQGKLAQSKSGSGESQDKFINRAHIRNDIKSLRKCLNATIKTVTSSNYYGHKSRSRYALPWYLILGTQYSGKTSILLNSGIRFKLNEQLDQLFSHTKSTEKCEVFYGNEAIFLDTPGSYTKCSLGSPEHKIWMMLLTQLARLRRANPLNGVIVCVSMRDIMLTDQAKREQAARTLRMRLEELLKRLHSRIPMYLIFTKCDAISGFSQFFSNLSRYEREQIFGCPCTGESMELNSIGLELKNLLHTINEQIIFKIHQERDVATRGDMFRFPQELSFLAPRIEDFINDVFAPSRYHLPVMLRGFFLTSAIPAQDELAETIREDENSSKNDYHRSIAGNSNGLFLQNLLSQFIISESNLAVNNKEYRFRHFLRQNGMQLTAIASFLCFTIFLGISFINNFSRIEKLTSQYTEFENKYKNVSISTDSRLELPILEKIHSATTIYDPQKDSSISYGLGLYQGNHFDKATKAAYLNTLNTRLLPSLRMAAITKIDSSLSNTAELKSAFQAYLMLCQPERINAKFLNGWLERQWADQYSGKFNVRQELRHHMDYLLEHGIMAAEPDATIVDRARKALLNTPLAHLVYQRLQEEALESGKPPFTFHTTIGDSAFTGDNYAIPVLYTKNGYDEYLIKRCPEIIRNITSEDWIYGENPIIINNLDTTKINKEIRMMYFRDYTKHWNQAIQELQVRTPTSIADAHNIAEQMTNGVSPTVLVARELKINTNLITDHFLIENLESNNNNSIKNKERNDSQHDALTVQQYFQPICNLLADDGSQNQSLKAVNDKMASVAEYFGRLINSDNKDKAVLAALLEIADEKDNTLRLLENSADRLPPMVRRWYATVASGGLREMLLIGANNVNRAYQDYVISIYNKNLRSYYPFNVHSDKDVNLDDFSGFFRGGGVLDNFYELYLRPFITRSGTLRSIMGRTLPVSTKAVIQLQLANRVQEAFFMSGRELGINFLMEPYALDVGLKQVSLIHSGKTLKYWHGPVQGAGFSWPMPSGQPDLTVLEISDLNGLSLKLITRGEWALFRMLQRGTIKRQEGNTCLLEIIHNDKWAQFLIQFHNKSNPFDQKICSFILPETLL